MEPAVGSSARASWRLFRVAVPAVVAALLVAAVLMIGPWPGQDRVWIVTDVGAVLADLLALAAVTYRVTQSPPGPVRRAWLLIAGALAAYLVADGIWAWTDLSGRVMGYPSVADAFFVAGVLPALVALVLFPVAVVVPLSRTRLLLDALVVSSAVALISFTVVLRDVFGSLGTGLGAVVNAFYPVADLLLVGVVGLLLLRSGRSAPRVDLLLLGAGFVCYAFSDSAFAVVTLDGVYESTVVSDLPYIAAPLLIGLAALAPPPGDPEAPSGGARLVSAVVPDLAVMAAVLTSLAAGDEGWRDSWLILLTVALAVLRQVWLASENHRLRSGLEKRVEERTAENRALAARYEHILESVGEGILGLDTDGRISFVNETGARLVGTTPDQLVGGDACVMLHGPAAHAPAECPLLTTGDQQFVRGNGTSFPVDVMADPNLDLADPEVVVVFRDVTELRAAERLKSEFISVVSHELRTPLTSIHGALHLLQDGDVGELPASADRVVDLALRGTDRLGRLVNDILVMDRLESGRLPLDIAEHDAGQLVTSVMTTLAPIAGVEGITLSQGAVHCRIRVDADRFVQVLTNLVGNAIKFTPRGGDVRVAVEVGADLAEVSVADTGPGIPSDHHETVFERFRQLDGGHRQPEGSGLGLAISRSLVEHQGGRLWVESEVGHGSTFRFTVPLVEAPAVRRVAEPPAADPASEDAPISAADVQDGDVIGR